MIIRSNDLVYKQCERRPSVMGGVMTLSDVNKHIYGHTKKETQNNDVRPKSGFKAYRPRSNVEGRHPNRQVAREFVNSNIKHETTKVKNAGIVNFTDRNIRKEEFEKKQMWANEQKILRKPSFQTEEDLNYRPKRSNAFIVSHGTKSKWRRKKVQNNVQFYKIDKNKKSELQSRTIKSAPHTSIDSLFSIPESFIDQPNYYTLINNYQSDYTTDEDRKDGTQSRPNSVTYTKRHKSVPKYETPYDTRITWDIEKQEPMMFRGQQENDQEKNRYVNYYVPEQMLTKGIRNMLINNDMRKSDDSMNNSRCGSSRAKQNIVYVPLSVKNFNASEVLAGVPQLLLRQQKHNNGQKKTLLGDSTWRPDSSWGKTEHTWTQNHQNIVQQKNETRRWKHSSFGALSYTGMYTHDGKERKPQIHRRQTNERKMKRRSSLSVVSTQEKHVVPQRPMSSSMMQQYDHDIQDETQHYSQQCELNNIKQNSMSRQSNDQNPDQAPNKRYYTTNYEKSKQYMDNYEKHKPRRRFRDDALKRSSHTLHLETGQKVEVITGEVPRIVVTSEPKRENKKPYEVSITLQHGNVGYGRGYDRHYLDDDDDDDDYDEYEYDNRMMNTGRGYLTVPGDPSDSEDEYDSSDTTCHDF